MMKMNIIVGSIGFFLTTFGILPVNLGSSEAVSCDVGTEYIISFQNNPITESVFTQVQDSKTESIPYKTMYEKTENLEYGVEEVSQEGRDGEIVTTYTVYMWGGQEIDREPVSTSITDPVNKVILLGTKKVPRVLNTPEGDVMYYAAYAMTATSYDGNCLGCSGFTFTGVVVTKGVCAVDPDVIPLKSKLYVQGYGFCSAEDIGGNIRGNSIDLGFSDVKQGFWTKQETNVYVLME